MTITNPILMPDVFVPDVEAHVWEDGRIYLYGSFDLSGKRTYCSDVYHVYFSDNLRDWTDHGVSFSLAATKDGWAKDQGALYAPDCAYRNGTYYLYYCVPDGRCGVAVSGDPAGPFEDLGPMERVHGIDPAVLLDDDGQAWFYWGQFDRVRAARLRDNMTEIDPDTAVQPLSVAEHEFHEGSSVKKIGGKYYYLFTDTHRHGGRATSLGYAVSDRPDRGFRYGGMRRKSVFIGIQFNIPLILRLFARYVRFQVCVLFRKKPAHPSPPAVRRFPFTVPSGSLRCARVPSVLPFQQTPQHPSRRVPGRLSCSKYTAFS